MSKVIVSAGDSLTAKMVEDKGFDGIWVSGFETCARLGLPDNGSITLFEMINVVRPIVERVSIPVYVDVDTGYNNFKRTVKEFEKIGVAGICVEDNMPNKQNSLWGGKREIMGMEAFGSKINIDRKKIKIIARTEALIRGYGTDEARKRIRHYTKCGADMVLPHVRDPKDIMRVGKLAAPHAIIPTMFPLFDNEYFFKMGYEMVIWANQTERVKIKSTRKFLDFLKINRCPMDYPEAATIKDIRSLMPDE